MYLKILLLIKGFRIILDVGVEDDSAVMIWPERVGFSNSDAFDNDRRNLLEAEND